MTSLPKLPGLTAYEVRFRVVEQRKALVFARSPEQAVARAREWHDADEDSDYIETVLVESADDWQACEVLP